ncbi:CHASE2 domain-containing protein [Xylanibacter muris]|uniref:CHASE2 domain-containing protein n=1 Tax=Xylanibacter muris TaxID=2736290 RepID=A0ABX2AKP5_9BACT|nr:CHASE2 domain-containing protein [Xylanibacter muris]NPD91142.1 CHASE2 domain-containing protein [Xylanibacter muris]
MKLTRGLVRHIAVTAMSFAVVGLFVIMMINISFLNPIARAFGSFSTIDIYYQMLVDDPVVSTDISIIDISTVESRRDIAAIINEAESLGPKTIGMDIVFANWKDADGGDDMIMNIAGKYDNIVFAANCQFDAVRQSYLKNRSFFTPFINVKEGMTNFNRELYSDMKRDMNIGICLGDSLWPSFAWLTASVSSDGITPLKDRKEVIDFSPTLFPVIAPDSITAKSDLIKDRIILIGAVGDDVDRHYTPLGKISGVELQAYSIQTLLQRKSVRPMPAVVVAVLSFLIVLITEWLQEKYIQVVGWSKFVIVRHFLSTDMALGAVTFVWMLILLYISVILFAKTRMSIDIGWALSAIAILAATRNFYNTCISIKRNNK